MEQHDRRMFRRTARSRNQYSLKFNKTGSWKNVIDAVIQFNTSRRERERYKDTHVSNTIRHFSRALTHF